jgi:hypothetical protein
MKCALLINLQSCAIIVMVSRIVSLYIIGSGPIPYRERDWRKHNKLI